MRRLPLSDCPRCKQVDRYYYSDNASRYFTYNDEAIAPMIPFFVEKLKDPEVKYRAATVLDAYLYDNLPDRNKAIKDEIKNQKVDLKDPVFEYLRKKLVSNKPIGAFSKHNRY